MAANVLEGVVRITAPGIDQTFDKAGQAVKRFEQQMSGLATGSIAQLKVAAASLKAQLENLTPKALTSTFGRQLTGALSTVNLELNKLEKQAGLSGKAVQSFGTKSFGAIRSLANILPGIGIAGLFGLAFAGVEQLLSSVTSAAGRLTETIGAAKDKFVSAATSVSELKNNIELAKGGFISKEGVVKQYNETLGKTFGFVKSLDEAEQGLVRNANAYIAITLQKAVAHIAAGKAADAYFKILTIQSAKDFQKASIFGPTPAGEQIGIIQRTKALDNLNKEFKQFNDIASTANLIAATFSKIFGANFFGDNKEVKVPEIKIKPDKIRIRPPLGSIQLELPTVFDTLSEDTRSRLQQQLDAIAKNINLKLPIGIDLSLPGKSFRQGESDEFKRIKQHLLDLQEVGQSVAQTMATAFSGLFETIANGQNVFQAIGGVIKQVVIQLIQAVIQAAILSVIAKALGVPVPGGNIFSSLFKAKGGPVRAGGSYIVGEEGPELFTPNTGGRIIPNNQIGRGGFVNSGMTVQVTGEFIQRGMDLVAVVTLANQSKLRLQ